MDPSWSTVQVQGTAIEDFGEVSSPISTVWYFLSPARLTIIVSCPWGEWRAIGLLGWQWDRATLTWGDRGLWIYIAIDRTGCFIWGLRSGRNIKMNEAGDTQIHKHVQVYMCHINKGDHFCWTKLLQIGRIQTFSEKFFLILHWESHVTSGVWTSELMASEFRSWFTKAYGVLLGRSGLGTAWEWLWVQEAV